MASSRISKRQSSGNTSDLNGNDSLTCPDFECSATAYAVKWAIIAAIVIIFGTYFMGGYLHAQRRMKKGLPPLAYHRWLINRRQKAAFVQQYPQYANQFSFYRAQQFRAGPYGYGSTHGQAAQAYQMGGMYAGPPPPAYTEPEYVPPYSGPNKVDPDQRYSAPSGPPPPASAAVNGPAVPAPARVAP